MATNDNETVAKNLKTLRDANGYTQEKLAEYLGINRSAYANYESGSREAPLAVLEQLANLYGCDLYSLYENNENWEETVLAAAFRVDGLSTDDMKQMAAFKRIVMNDLKMDKMLSK